MINFSIRMEGIETGISDLNTVAIRICSPRNSNILDNFETIGKTLLKSQ
jgi:hypothetical protein